VICGRAATVVVVLKVRQGFNFCAAIGKASQILSKAVFDFYACG